MSNSLIITIIIIALPVFTRLTLCKYNINKWNFFLLKGKIYHKWIIIEVACPFMFEIRVVSLWTISSNEWRINHVLCQKVAYMDRCFDNHRRRDIRWDRNIALHFLSCSSEDA